MGVEMVEENGARIAHKKKEKGTLATFRQKREGRTEAMDGTRKTIKMERKQYWETFKGKEEALQEQRYQKPHFTNFLHFYHYHLRKGTQFVIAITRIAKTPWGAKFRDVRRLFNSVMTRKSILCCIGMARKHGRLQQLAQVKFAHRILR